MDNLGEDLVLLSIKPDQGLLLRRRSLEFGLMGSELVRLAALGRIAITDDAVIIRDPSPTRDAELDQALYSLATTRRPPQAKTWVSSPRRGITDAYLARLTRSGVVQPEQRRDFLRIKYTVWRITDPGRYAYVRSVLDGIARSGGPIDIATAAFAGLAHAAGVTGLLYPGRANHDVRRRFEQIAKGGQSAPAVRAAREALDRPLDPSIYTEAAARSASDAAMLAAAGAAAQAAVQAATEAAVHAAVHATTHASTDSGGHHDGGSSGGHH